MPPRRTVEIRSCGMSCTLVRRGETAAPRDSPEAPAWIGHRERGLLPLVPGAERDPLGPGGGKILRPHGHELASLPLEHVVVDALVGVLAVLGELHPPPADPGAHREVQAHAPGAGLL